MCIKEKWNITLAKKSSEQRCLQGCTKLAARAFITFLNCVLKGQQKSILNGKLMKHLLFITTYFFFVLYRTTSFIFCF